MRQGRWKYLLYNCWFSVDHVGPWVTNDKSLMKGNNIIHISLWEKFYSFSHSFFCAHICIKTEVYCVFFLLLAQSDIRAQ